MLSNGAKSKDFANESVDDERKQILLEQLTRRL